MNAAEITDHVARAMHGNRYEWPRPEFSEHRDEYRKWAKIAVLATLDAIREPSEAMIENAAAAAYWQRVDPDKGAVTLSVAVMDWSDLPDEHRSGIQVWHCKQFWRDAAQAAIGWMIDALKKEVTG